MASANHARFFLTLAECDRDLRVLGFQAREALSELFEIQVDVACTDPELDLDRLLGRDALLRIERPGPDSGPPRLFHGCLHAIEQGATGPRWTLYTLWLAPRPHWLTLRRNLRIFQQLSVPDIARQLLREAGFKPDSYRFELTRDYSLRAHCVQYNESEWAFIQRLLAEEGIHFHFEHRETDHILVLADHEQSLRPLPERAIPYYDEDNLAGPPAIRQCRLDLTQTIDALTLMDYNPNTPRQDLRVHAENKSETPWRHHIWPGGFESAGQGERRARDQLAASRVERELLRGQSTVPWLEAGRTFELAGHRRDLFNRDWLLLEVRHWGRQPQVLEEEAPSHEGFAYRNEFRAQPADRPWRPAPLPKPRARGVYTAILAGPPGEQIHADDQGLVQVRFHWDREGRHSCWLRLLHRWADDAWGSQMLPRVGQEVLIRFLHQDPDQPVVAGCLYHGLHKPPYPLPEHQGRTLLRSRSLGGIDGHEFMLEDAPGSEGFQLRSTGDWELDIERDRFQDIGQDDHRSLAGSLRERIEGTVHRTIGGESRTHIRSDDSLDVGQSQHLFAHAGIHLQASRDIHLHAGARLCLDGGQELCILGGGSRIRLGGDGVFLDGLRIDLNGGSSAGAAEKASPKAPDLPDSDKN